MFNLKHLLNGNKKKELNRIAREKEKKVHEILNGFISKDNAVIPLKTLMSLEIDKWYDVDGGKYKLIELTDKEAIFITEMDAGGSFGIHEHDCIERGIVVEGHLIDDLNHLKVLKNETFKYAKGQPHKPYCRVKSTYEVTFSEF